MLQVLHPNVSKVDRVLHLCLRFSNASPSPRCLFLLPALARHLSPPPPLLDADVATYCSHLLQFAGHVYAHEKRQGRERGLIIVRRVERRGPRVGGHGMQVRGGDGVQARASVWTSGH
jgi:hypothetical protein